MASSSYAPRLRPERLIAAGRVLLAVSSLFAVWLDPDEPVRYAGIAYSVLVGYAVYASAVAALVWQLESVSGRWPVVTHAIDLVCFSLVIFFTEGPASPFTVFFVFALLSATLRWQARGTLWTAVVVLAAFFGFAIYYGAVLDDPDFDRRALIIRGVYLVVLAGLLGYVGTQDRRTLDEMWRLASWPQTVRQDAETLARDLLAYAAALVGAPRALLAWAEPDAPVRRLAAWDGAHQHWRVERERVDRPLVEVAVRDRAFIRHGGAHPRTLVHEPSALQLVVHDEDPLDAEFVRRFVSGTVLSLPLQGESVEGRLFFFDKPDATLDDLVLGEVVSGVITARLDAYYLSEQLRQTAATEERIRLARDLHDGVLQSFTGVALRLEAVRRMMHEDRPAVLSALTEAQRILASEQRDVRFFIEELKPTGRARDDAGLESRLTDLALRMDREWDLRVSLDLSALDAARVPATLGREVYHIVREALMNAARHGAATAVRVAVVASPPAALRITISDNGRGFGFEGRYTFDELTRLDLGPKTLRERVRAMNGSLVLATATTGVELDVILPLAEVA